MRVDPEVAQVRPISLYRMPSLVIQYLVLNLVFLSRSAVRSVSFSPCGGRIAGASMDCTIKVWEASTGTCQSALSGHSSYVRSVCFSPDGKQIASGSEDKTVKIWNASTGELQSTLRHSDR